ncbi:MAG TPA: DNA repair protein RecO [Pyrinomonadaceae bacterium]|nr:DNA repair protein RecO [Pyrinomonadaceae bacterium]
MPLVETDSLVLKSYNLAEADRIVVLLTRDHGVVRGVAKGAKRLKSRFGSGLEPFSEIRATYFQKDNLELVSIQSTELIRSNFAAASEPSFLEKFSYLGDLLVSFLPPHDPNETVYRMVRASVETATAAPEALDSIGLYFELWLLRLAGFLPDWNRCDHCGRELPPDEEANVQANFHLLCQTCRRATSRRVITGAQREIVKDAMRLAPTAFAGSRPDEASVTYISQILRDVISAALGRDISGVVAVGRQGR